MRRSDESTSNSLRLNTMNKDNSNQFETTHLAADGFASRVFRARIFSLGISYYGGASL